MGRQYTDSQRSRLYRAEKEAFKDSAFEDSVTEDEAREIIAKGWSTAPGLLGRAPTFRTSRRVGSGAAWYFENRHEILFNPERVIRWVVIHELAHAVEREGAGHGPEFARAYLGLVERAFGFDMREKLGAAFRKHKVRSTGKSASKKKGTGPKRETKREKADKLAAAAGLKIVVDDWNRHWYDVHGAEEVGHVMGLYGLDEVIRFIESRGEKNLVKS